MDNELHKIINGLENAAHERGMHKGYALGVIRVFQKLRLGMSESKIINELLQDVPHAEIRHTIESVENVDGGMDEICCQIDELLMD